MARILVVDDEILNLDLMRQELEERGFEVDTAQSAAEARQLLGAQLADLIILDIQMPGEDGLTFCRRLNEDPAFRSIPVIFCTANCSEDEQIILGLTTGAVDYVVKPVSVGVLLARIKIQLQIKQLQDELRQKNSRLEALSVTDPLTGLRNRRMLDAELAHNPAVHRHLEPPVACLMVDIDHFKSVNDRFGHCCGDYVLQTIARLMQMRGSSHDLLVRYGGDEFACFLSQKTAAEALVVAEQIRCQVASHPLPNGPPGLSVTVSIGCATQQQTQLDLRALIEVADAALYAAKKQGRNRVAQLPSPVLPGPRIPLDQQVPT